MSKKDFIKRAGQIYALGIQRGLDVDKMMVHMNEAFDFLYKENKSKGQ